MSPSGRGGPQATPGRCWCLRRKEPGGAERMPHRQRRKAEERRIEVLSSFSVELLLNLVTGSRMRERFNHSRDPSVPVGHTISIAAESEKPSISRLCALIRRTIRAANGYDR